jgi:hypothetical protein
MTTKPPRLKPLAAQVSLMGKSGEPDLPLGEITLHPIHQDADSVWLSGVLTRNGKPIASLNLNALPLHVFPTSPPPGRPPETAKHKAVLLSWIINHERGGKRGEADNLTCKRFHYSEPKKVRDIRKAEGDLPDKLVIRLDEKGQEGYACWIEKPTLMLDDNGRLEILGIAWSWHESMGQQATYGAIRMTSKMENINTEAINDIRGKRGPIIVVVY